MKIRFRKRILPAILVVLLALTTFTAFSGCGDDKGQTYTVVYHLNYTEAERAEREAIVVSGAKAVDWKPTREGYAITGWFTDARCSAENKFDFSKAIKSDTDLYAGWKVQNTYTVSFDYNFGGLAPVEIAVKDGNTIDSKLIPSVTRLGKNFEGWYTDEACTNKWDIETGIVTSDTTLFAGYSEDGSVRRDADGNVVYEDAVVNVWVGANFGMISAFQKIAEEFNALHEGEITVNVTTSLISQGSFALRFQQTPEKSKNENTYYSIAQVYDLAGLEIDESDWFEGAARDSYVEGNLTSVPIVAGVPYFVYNKDLMQKYNRGTLPANFKQLSALLKAAYEGESVQNEEFKSILCAYNNWAWKEAPSYTAFVQNGADYFVFEDGGYVNKWSDTSVFKKAVTAMENTYALFGSQGECGGGEYTASDTDQVARTANGESMMTMVCYPGFTGGDVLSNSSKLGILPLSGLFTDTEGGQADQIPVHTAGLAFYNGASNVSMTDLAAAAVFADYVSKNSYAFAEVGWYPVSKSVVNSDAFKNSANATVRILRKTGDPENFRSMDGNRRGKSIVNDYASNEVLIPALNSDGKNLRDYVSILMSQISGSLY